MKPYIHAQLSAKKHGGIWEDYIDIHDYLDISKSTFPDMRHRTILHNSLGCYLVEMQYGYKRENSEGRSYSTRDIAEEHIIEDLGFIPSVHDYLQHLPMDEMRWVGGMKKIVRQIPLVD